MSAAAAPSTPRAGARYDGRGTHFCVVSRHAEAVEVCLLGGEEEAGRRPLARQPGDSSIWWAYLEGVGPGQHYGYRVHGPWDPGAGHRFNPAKLLVDPWARAVDGEPRWNEALLGFDPGRPLAPSEVDSAPFVPRAMVVDPAFDWGDDRPPRTPWRDSVFYECHVKGMTALHPALPPERRGTYLGLAEPAVIEHLQALGVTAVELLPVFQIAAERHLLESGRPNYFGYSPLSLFAPHAGYAAGGAATAPEEFRSMVRSLHAAGLEVLLDVVYNHTPEGGPHGPTLTFRGLDNRLYYRSPPGEPGAHVDWSGCGNSLDCGRDEVVELVVDSLRFWVEEMHVDGFRFDLAVSLGRGASGEFDPGGGLLERLASEPALEGVKLIAEPWDLGPGGYRLGGFPTPWGEWNDRFRDAARSFWRGDPDAAEPLRRALAGTTEAFPAARRDRAVAYVTSHDGFTLADLVSYERKHNLENGEDNRDGTDHNLSRNWGVEGPTDDAEIVATRDRVRRALAATLALAPGVPMLSHGDELGRTQQGNNNAYCQDGPLTWVAWEWAAAQPVFEAFRGALALRRRIGGLPAEIEWLTADGTPLEGDSAEDSCFALRWNVGATALYAVVNGGGELRQVRLPEGAEPWRLRFESSAPAAAASGPGRRPAAARSVSVFSSGTWPPTPEAP